MPTYRGQGTADASTTTSNTILRESLTATASQTLVDFASVTYLVGSNQLDVFVDGSKQVLGTDYTETDSNSITFVTPLTGGEVIEVEAIRGGNLVESGLATNVAFTHQTDGAVQTTVDAWIKAQNIDLVADLKTTDGAQIQVANVRGQFTLNDGGGGRYYWDKDSTATDTSATTGLVVQQTGVTTGRWIKVGQSTFTTPLVAGDTLDVTGAITAQSTITATGDITTSGNLQNNGDLIMAEQADHTSTPAAGFGYLWTKNTVPSTLFFTDDTGADLDISSLGGGTVTVSDESVDTTCFPLFSTAATGVIAPSSNAALTFNSATGALGATTFVGALTGNAQTATTAGTVTTPAQPNITSLGTLTALTVDNININGDQINHTSSGSLLIEGVTLQNGAVTATPGFGVDGISVTTNNGAALVATVTSGDAGIQTLGDGTGIEMRGTATTQNMLDVYTTSLTAGYMADFWSQSNSKTGYLVRIFQDQAGSNAIPLLVEQHSTGVEIGAVFQADAGNIADIRIAGDGNAVSSAFQLAQENTTDDAFIWNLATSGDLRFGAGNGLAAVVDATTKDWDFQGDISLGDNGNVYIGASNDARLYHVTGSNLVALTSANGVLQLISSGNSVDLAGGGTIGFQVDANGQSSFQTGIHEKVSTTGGGTTPDIDLNFGTIWTHTVATGTTTFTFSNAGTGSAFTLILTNGGSQTVNWPAAVDWAGGTAPTLTSAGVDILTFLTSDGGTTWYGFSGGLDFS